MLSSQCNGLSTIFFVTLCPQRKARSLLHFAQHLFLSMPTFKRKRFSSSIRPLLTFFLRRLQTACAVSLGLCSKPSTQLERRFSRLPNGICSHSGILELRSPVCQNSSVYIHVTFKSYQIYQSLISPSMGLEKSDAFSLALSPRLLSSQFQWFCSPRSLQQSVCKGVGLIDRIGCTFQDTSFTSIS